jgi:hypothetical protein
MKYKVTVAELDQLVDGNRSYDRETDIYTQIVEDVDIRAVIDTVNGPKPLVSPVGAAICLCTVKDGNVWKVNPECPTHGGAS